MWHDMTSGGASKFGSVGVFPTVCCVTMQRSSHTLFFQFVIHAAELRQCMWGLLVFVAGSSRCTAMRPKLCVSTCAGRGRCCYSLALRRWFWLFSEKTETTNHNQELFFQCPQNGNGKNSKTYSNVKKNNVFFVPASKIRVFMKNLQNLIYTFVVILSQHLSCSVQKSHT